MVVKKVGFDDAIAGDCEKNIDLGDVYSGGGDSKDGDGVDDIGAGDINGGDNVGMVIANCSDCSDNVHDVGGDSGDDGLVDSNIGNDANCGDGKSKGDCIEVTAGDDSNSNIGGGFNGDGVGDTNNKSDEESNGGVDGHKTNDGVNDGGCINFVKNCFENKHIDVANFTRSSLGKGNL